MNVIHPLADAQKRKRLSGVMEDGEYLGFEVAFVDAATAATASRFLTDYDRELAIRAEVDRQHAIHDHKFAFLGSKAPTFNRDNAELIVRSKLQNIAHASDRSRALAAARYHDSARAAATTGLNAWRGGTHAAEHESRVADAQSARSAVDALRHARYGSGA